MKVILNEEQLKKLIETTIFYEGRDFTPNKSMKSASNKVYTYMQNLARHDKEKFDKTAKELSLDPEDFAGGEKKYAKTYQDKRDAFAKSAIQDKYDKNTNTVITSVDDNVSDEIKNAAKRIKEYIHQNKMGGTVDWSRLKQDPDYDYLMRMKDLLDRQGLSSLYDDNAALTTTAASEYNIQKGDDENFNYVGVDNNILKKYNSIRDFWKSRLGRYMDSKFGIQIKMPKMFGQGNGKVPTDTLIVNFTSSFRCPAWNECLVKHACYARADQKRENTSFYADTNKNLMWELTRTDDTMMGLMMNMLKTYIFNYDYIYNETSGILKKNGVKSLEDLINLDLSNPIIQETLGEKFRKHANVQNIRLNENGDFIGQWLVDAFDKFGSELAPFGIKISAYTCRNLNFEGIKNIILNSSNIANKGVDRYFIAITEKAYNAFDDTNEGFENGRLKVVLKPLGKYDETGNWTPTGEYYYKCPCGDTNVLGPKVKREDKALTDYDCYKCNNCYLPNTNGKPYYVFVKVHGGGANNLEDRNAGNFSFGFSEHYQERMAAMGKPKKSVVKEEIEPEVNNSDIALQQVARNAVYSVNKHFSEFGTQLKEDKVKNDFKTLLERINNTEF